MIWLFVFALMGVCALLWSRLERAERRLEANETLLGIAMERLRSLGDAGHPEQPSTAESTAPEVTEAEAAPEPAVALVRSDAEPSVSQPAPAPPEPEPLAEIPDEEPVPGFAERITASLDFEDIFGRRLPIWAGGVALAVAGVFMVRWSIDQGLLTPQVRVVLAFLFGLALLAGAELAYRFEARVADERVRQALAGAGLATLYAGFYLAGTQYGLIGQTLAFLGLAAITAAAIALSYRFGLPSAVLGLVGGFAAPMLVGSDEPNLPLLALYLGLVTAGLVVTGRRQERPWLGITAMVGGLGWGMLLLLAGDFGWSEVLALGLYFIVLGTVLPALSGARSFETPLRVISAGVASIQIAALIAQGGYSALSWGLYLLLGSALTWLAWRREDLRPAAGFAALVGLMLLGAWSDPDPYLFAAVAAAAAVLFAGTALFHLARSSETLVDRVMLLALPPALAVVGHAQFGSFDPHRVEAVLAAAILALGALPAAAAWLLRARGDALFFALYTGAAAALAFGGMLLLTPHWSEPVLAALVCGGVALLVFRRGDAQLANLLWAAALVCAGALVATPDFLAEAGLFGEIEGTQETVRAVLRWLAAATPFAALAVLEQRKPPRHAGEAIAALLVFGALAQVVPAQWQAWAAAALAAAAFMWLRPRTAAHAVFALVTFAWALLPLTVLLRAGGDALVGIPVFVTDIPEPRMAMLRLLPAALALGLLVLPDPVRADRKIPLREAGIALAALCAYIFFKQVFAIETLADFAAQGMAERTVWQALLLGAGVLAAREWPRIGRQDALSLSLIGASLAHFALFTLLLHNPLWDRQAVGPLVIANLALAAYGTAIAAVLLLKPRFAAHARPWVDGVVMALVTLGALTLLRQAFGGSVMADHTMTQAEDLLRSLLGILLALGFLFLGMRRSERSWRVGSLVVMLIAVVKVFIFDAAGLEGLGRIASFAVLGAALIGIGWLYTQLLKRADSPSETLTKG